jgi:hypothetical protein
MRGGGSCIIEISAILRPLLQGPAATGGLSLKQLSLKQLSPKQQAQACFSMTGMTQTVSQGSRSEARRLRHQRLKVRRRVPKVTSAAVWSPSPVCWLPVFGERRPMNMGAAAS